MPSFFMRWLRVVRFRPRLQLAAGTADERALDHILQLSHVTGPAMAFQASESGRGQDGRRPAHARRNRSGEVQGEIYESQPAAVASLIEQAARSVH